MNSPVSAGPAALHHDAVEIKIRMLCQALPRLLTHVKLGLSHAIVLSVMVANPGA